MDMLSHLIFSENFLSSWMFFFSLVFICLPLGFSVASAFFKEQNIARLVAISVLLGVTLTFGIWSILVLFHIPFNSALFISLNVLLPTLVIIYNFRRKKIGLFLACNKIELALLVISFLLCFAVLANYFTGYPVPPDVDSQLHGYIQILTQKTGNYLQVKPFLDETTIANAYPPGYNLMNVAISDLTGIPIIKILISSAIVYFALTGLSLFILLLLISENLVVSFGSTIFFLSRGTLWVANDSQFTELAAMLVTCVFIILFWKSLKQREFKSACLAGITFGISGLVHSRFFLWLGIGIASFFITLPLSREKTEKKDYQILLITLFSGILTILPWLINKISLLKPDLKHLSSQALYFWLDVPIKLHGLPLTIFALVGLAVLLYKRGKIEIFLATWLLALLGFIQYWRVLKLLSPSWFKIILNTSGTSGGFKSSGQFMDIFKFVGLDMLAWYGLIVILSIVAAYSLAALEPILGGKNHELAAYKTLLILSLLGFSLFYLHNEGKNAIIIRPFITRSDYSVLLWVKNNTEFDNTLILNIGRPYQYLDRTYLPRHSSRWAPVISERKAISFRRGQVFNKDEVIRVQDLFRGIYFHLDKAENYQYLKQHKISHVFLPSFFYNRKGAFDRSPYLRLISQAYKSCIYKVVEPSPRREK